MDSIKLKLSRLLADERGLELSEYAVAGALIVTAGVLAFTNLGSAIQARINAITAAIG